MSDPRDTLQSAVEDVITSWPDVRAKQVFGHRGYVRNGKMFAFLADDGLSFKARTAEEAEALYESGAATPFVYNGSMEMRGWPVLPLATDDQLPSALTAAQTAYENVG
jgi:TfoX/Sxy family transcriptional regulator of competence genes